VTDPNPEEEAPITDNKIVNGLNIPSLDGRNLTATKTVQTIMALGLIVFDSSNELCTAAHPTADE